MARRDQDFTAAFREHYPSVLAFARRRVGETGADDVAAEVFAVAWRRWGDAPRDVRPWLFGIAKNVMSTQARAQRRRARLHERVRLQPPVDAADPGEGVAAGLDLRSAWSQLSEDDREVIALVAWDGLTQLQAAEVLEISRMAYAARLSRARKRFRRRLAEHERRQSAEPPGVGEPARTWALAFTRRPAHVVDPGGDER